MDQQIHKICHNVYKKCFGKGKKNNKLQLFLQPVDLKKYPDYVKKIKGNKPMDLATLKKNLNVKYTRSAYATFDEFCADARLIFDNCKLYNSADAALCKNADDILGQFDTQVKNEMGKVETRLAKIATFTFPEYEQAEMILDQCISVISLNELFGAPVALPSYSIWIKEPMDFSTIKKKLKDGKYANFDAFERDMVLVGTNCLHFNNDPDKQSGYRDTAVIYLEKFIKLKKQYLKDFREIPLKSRFYACRRALDLILLRERNGVYKLNNKLSRPWKFHVVKVKTEESSSSSSSNENKGNEIVTLGDVSDKLYSLSYKNEQEFIEDLKSIFNKPAPFPENRDKKIIEEEASFFLRYVDTISKLIALPVDEGTKLPIEPKDYSDDFPTKWFYELSYKEMIEVVDEVCLHSELKTIFYAPVDVAALPTYENYIKDKLDLSTIRARLKSGIWYYMPKQVLADVDLVANNCKIFNALYPKYVQLAKSLQSEAKSRYNNKVKQEQYRITEEKRKAAADKKRLQKEEVTRKRQLAAAERQREANEKAAAKAEEKAAREKAAREKAAAKKAQNDIATNAMLKRKKSFIQKNIIKDSNNNNNKVLTLGNNKKRKRDQKGPPKKKARAGPPKGPPRGPPKAVPTPVDTNVNKNNGTFSLDGSSIGVPGTAAGAIKKKKVEKEDDDENEDIEAGLRNAQKRLDELTGKGKAGATDIVAVAPPVFGDIGMKEVLAAVKKKNKGREPKLSPIEEDCKKVYHKLNKDVVGISKISLNKHYADNFAHKWLSLFNFHPLEVFPQEAFKMNYMHVVPKPIALYFSKDPENEAVYDNLLQRVYKTRFDENPEGPTIAEMFVSDVERCFNNAIMSNSNGSEVSDWICIKARHLLMYLDHVSHENLFNEDIPRYNTKRAEKKILRREREDFIKGLELSNSRAYGVDRTQEFIVKVMKKMKTQGMKITFQHWNSPKEELMKYPGYTDVIKKAMDLSSVYDMINKRMYNTYQEVLDDIRLCFSNAITFWSRKGTENPEVVANAKKSSEYFENLWAQASLTIYEYIKRERILHKVLNQQKTTARAAEKRKERLEQAKEEVKKQRALFRAAKKERKQKKLERRKAVKKDKFHNINEEWESIQKKYRDDLDEDDDSSSDSDDDDDDMGRTNEVESNEAVESNKLIQSIEEEWREDDDIWREVGDKGVVVFQKQKTNAGTGSI